MEQNPTNALEIKNSKNYVFEYKMGEVNIKISVGEKELSDLREIASQLYTDVIDAQDENNTQTETPDSE